MPGLASVVLVLMLTVAAPQRATAPTGDAWAPFRFLLGEWTGEGQGQPGATSGTATFRMDLDGRVIVRTSRTAVPATGSQPSSVHQDLMVIYHDAPGRPARAIYFDNEDHTIEYDVTISADGKAVTFLTRALPSAPRFRLVYTQINADTVDVKFEMAPPGSPEAFKVYTQGVTKRVK